MSRLVYISILFTCLSLLPLKGQVAFHEEISNGKLHFYAINTSYAPLILNLHIDSLNINKSQFLEHTNDTIKLLEIILSDRAKKLDFRHLLRATVNFGNPNAKPDAFEYQLPFAKGSKFECIQSFEGKFSHNQPYSKYAIDFKMPEGTPVLAARSGIVVYTKEDSNEGGRDREKYINKANKVMIYHDDGTVASYDHLKFNGVEVQVGDRVKTGQLIGYSGNTGFSTTPHLHFVVWVVKEAVPIRFKGQRKTLKEGKYYGY